MRRVIKITVLLLLNYIACLYQVQAQVITLDSVLQIIDRQNLMLQVYDSKVKAQQAYVEGAKSWMAPMVGAGTFMTPYPGQKGIEEATKGSLMISVEQSIPNPARLNANKRYYESRVAVEEQGRAGAFNQLRAEAKTYYYRWVVAEEKLKILRENERIIDLMLRLARIRHPYNQGSLGNIYQAEGRLQEIQNMLLMTQGDIETNSYALKMLMNLPPETSLQVDTTSHVTAPSTQLLYDTAALGMQRSDVKQLDRSIEAMQLNREVQRMQAKPDFKIRFDHMQPLGDMPRQFTAMAMMSIPIAPWSSRMYRSEVKGMQYDIDAMKKEREALLVDARGMLAGMATKLSRMQQQITNYREKIIPALRRNYETLMLAYEENRGELPVVMDGLEALNMTQMEYLEKQEEYYMMIVSYEKELEK